MWVLEKGVFKFPLDDRLLVLFTTKGFNYDLSFWGIESLVRLNQIHSDRVFYIRNTRTYTGDGLITDKRGLYLSIKVADCLPVYLFSRDFKIIGLCHSGWRGTVKRIVEKMVYKMQKLFRIREISYILGPCIGVCHYDIGEDVIKIISKAGLGNFLIKRGVRTYFNLKEANREILKGLKAEEIASLDYCTYCRDDLFYSARRGDKDKRNLAIIGIKN